ncbi:serine-rich adhesin for platelets-like isoform X2 [Branchiostoma lanceolatum]|uniref:serine-rich adhesin for platelets-like isoform X2 n=1 Tax=Branchiostoma lanceolatum TaxID=7740 RepID=UPI0034564B8C
MVPYLRGLPHVFLILWIFGWAGGQSTISSDAGVSSTLVAGPSSSTPGASSTLQPSPSSLGGSSFSSSVATAVQPAADSQAASVSPSRTVPTSSQSALSPTFISTESNVDSSAISLGSLDLASSTATAGIISSMSGTTEILTPSTTITVLEISPVTATPALSLKQTATSALPSSISSGSISSSRTLTIVPSSPSEMSTQSPLTSAMTMNTTVSPQDTVSPSVALVSPSVALNTAVLFSGVELSSSLEPTETFASSSSVLSFSSSVVLTAAPPNSSSIVPFSVFATASVRPTGSFVSDSVSTPTATAVAMPSSAAFSSSKSFAVTKFSSSDTPLQSAQITPTTISVVNTVPTLSLNETAVPSTQVPSSSVTDTNMTSFLPSATSVQSTTTVGLLNTVSSGGLPSLEPSSMAVQPTEMLLTALPSEMTPSLMSSDLSYFAMPTIITSPSMNMTASSTEVATPVSVSAAASPSFSNVYNLTSTPAAEVLNISSTPSSSLAIISTSGLISNGTTVAPTSDPSPTASASLVTLTRLPINTTEIPDIVATSLFALNSSPAVTASETSSAPATNQSASFTSVPSPSYNSPSSEATTEIPDLFSTAVSMSELAPSETSVVIPSYVSFTESFMLSLPELSVLETESLYQTAAPSSALTTVSMLPSVPLTESVGLSLPNTEAVNSLSTTETQGIPTAPLSSMSSSPSLSEEMLSSSVVPTTLDTFEPLSVMSLSELFLLSTTAGTQLPASSLAAPSLHPSILPLTDLDLEFPSMSVTGMIEKQSISPSLLPMSGSASATLAASPVSTTQLSSSYFEAAVTVQPSQPISDSFDVETLETLSIPTFSMSDSEIYMFTSKSEMATSKTESISLPLKPTPSLISKSATDTEIFDSIHLSDIFSLESSLSPFDVSLQPSPSSPTTHQLPQPSSVQTVNLLSLYPLTELSGTASSVSSMPSGVTTSPEAPMISETVPLSSAETMSRSSSNEVDSFETLSLPPLEDIQTISQSVDSLTQSLLVEEPNPTSQLLSGIFTATDIEAIETISVTHLPSLLSMPSLSPVEILPATPTVIPLETFSLPFLQQSENISTMQSASSQPSDHFTTFPMSQTAVATLLPSEVVLPTSLPLETLQLTTLQDMETTSLSSHLVSKNTSSISLSTEAKLHNASSAEIDFSLISLPTLQLTDFPQFSDVSALSEPLSVPILATRTEIPSFAQPNLTDEISTSFLYQSKTDTLATLEPSNLYPSSAKLSVNELTQTPDFVDLETLSLPSFLMTDSLSIPLVQPMSSSVSVSMDSPSPPELSSPAVTLQSETAAHPVLKTLLPTSTVSARTPLLQSVSLSTLDTFVSGTERYPAFLQTLSLPSIEMLPSDTISSPTLQSTQKVSQDESLSMITMPDVSLNQLDSLSIVPVSTAILATSTLILLTLVDISSPLFQLPESLPASTALQSLAIPSSSLQSSYAVPAATASLEVSKPVNLQTETVSESLQNLETLSLLLVDLLPSETLQMASTPSVQDLSAFPSSETLSSGTSPSETVRAISSLSVQNVTAFPSPGTLSFVSVQPSKSVQTTSMPSLQDFTLLPGLETMSLADVQFSETLQMTSSPLQMTTVFNASVSVIFPSQTILPAISETFSVLPTLSVSDVGMPTPSFDILETLNVTESVLDTASFLSLLDMQTFTTSVLDLSMTQTVTETPSLLLNMSSVTLAPSTPDLTLLSLYDQSSLMSEIVSINFTEFLSPSDSLVDLITPSSPSVELSKTSSMSTNGSGLILPSQTIISSPLASPSPVTFSESVLSYTPTLAALETLAISRNMTSDMGTESASFNMGLPSLSELLQPSTQLSVIATTQPMKTEMISRAPQSEALLLPSSGVTVPVVSGTSATFGPSLPRGTSLAVGTPATTSAVTAELSSLGTMLQYETTSAQVLQTLDVSMSYVFSESAADMTPTSQLIGSPSVTLGPSGSAETSVLLSPTLQSSSSSFILMSNDDFEGSGSDLPFLSQTIPMLTQTASATSVSATSVPATSLQLSPSPSYSVDSFSSVVPSSVMSRSSLQLTPMPSFSQDLASFSLAPTAADTLGSSVPSATTTQTVVITPSLQPSPSQSYIIDSFSSSGPSSSLQPSLTPSYTPGLASFSLPLLSTVSLPVLESSPGFDGSGDGPATDLFFSSSPSLSTSSQTPSISLDFFTPSTALGTTIQPTASISAPNDTSVMTSFTLEAASSVEPLTPLTVSVFSSIEATLTPEGSGDMETSQFLQLESTPSISLSSIPTSISTASFGFSIPVTAFSSISEIVPTPSFSMDFPASTAFFESTQQFEGSGMSISEAFSETVSFTLAASFDSLSSTPAIPTMVSSQVGTATQALSPSLQETVTPSMEDISLPPFTMMSSMFLESTSLVLVIPSSTVDQETVTPSSSMEDVSLPPFTMVSSMFLESTSLVLLPSFTVDLLPSMSTEAASSSAGSVLVSSTTSVMSSAASVASQPSMVGISSSAVQPTSSIAASSSQSATPTPALPTTALISASALVSSGSAIASSVLPTSSLVASSSLLSSTVVEPSLIQIPSLIIAPSFTAVVVSSSAVVVSSSAVVTTQAPTSPVPTTQAPTSPVPTTQAPTTQPPTTQAPTTQTTSTPAPTTPGPATTTFSYVTANLSVELVLTWVNTVLVIPDTVDITVVQFYFTMEARLARAFAKARQRKAGMDVARNPILRRKRAATFENVTCQVINATRDNSTGRNDHVTLTYYVMYEGQAVPASQAVADLALLDEQEVALQLGYFVAQTEEYVPVTAPSDPMYWIIAAVLGPLFIIIIIVIWLVCCCKRTKSTEMAPDTVGELQKKGTPRGIAPAEMQKKVMTETLIPPGSYVVKVPAESRDAPPLPARRGQSQPRRSAKTKDRRQKSSKRRHSKRRSTEESEDSSFTSVTDRSSKPRSKKSPEYMLESDTGDSFASDAGSKAGLFEHVAKLSAVIEPTPQKPASRAFHSSVHPIKFPPLRTPLVTDRLRESIKENQQLSQSMRQKADIEHWRNKQLQRERSLRRKPSSPRGGYEHTAVGDTKDQRRAYKRAQQQIDSVLEPGSQIPAVLEPSRRRRMKRPHKRHGSHDIQGVTSPHDPELAMQFGQQPQGVYRPINGVPPLGPQPPMPVDSEGRSFEDESYTESDPETMPISQARERIHQLLDEAFSLISPSVPPRNTVAPAPNVTTVQPVQSTPQYAQPAGNGQVPNGMGATYMTPQAAYPQDLRTPQGPVPPPAHGRASTAGPRARRRFNGQSASSSDREPTADQPLFTRQPTVVFSPEQYQQAAAGRAAAPDPRARTSQATPASVNMGTPQQPLFVTPVQQKTDGSGSVLWSLYNAEDEVARMSQSREPASLPGGLDASPLLSRLQSTPMTRTSSLPSVTPPHLTPTTFPAPSPIGQSGYGSPFIGQPGTSPGSHPGMRTLGQSAFTPVRSSPGSDQSGAGSNPPSQLDDSRLRPGQDPDADEVDIMSGIRTGDSAQPLIQAIKEELKRLSGKTPVTTL